MLNVVATAGCTAVGAFDDLEAVAELCEHYGHWFHVDGAHGASALLSEKHRWRCKGIERADSKAWDPHKMMLMPLSAGMVLVREGKDLERAFAQSAPYLFRGADSEVELSPDLGKRSFQCSRRADAVKDWVALQRFGVSRIGALYDALCDSAAALHRSLSYFTGSTPLHQPEPNIVTWSTAHSGQREITEVRIRLNVDRSTWITATTLHGRRCLRVTRMSPRTRQEDIDGLVNSISQLDD